MPQINRAFNKSKMNKDFDERLVESGEYRDALNVQVQASDGSDVGTIQSVLGNVLMSSGMVPEGSKCVGAVTYDKEDKIYYLVAGPEFDIINDSLVEGTWKDYIIEYDIAKKAFKYVFVDIYRTHFFTSTTSTDRYLEVNDPLNPPISNARRGMTVNGFDPSNGNQIIITDSNEIVDVTFAGAVFPSPLPMIQIYSSSIDYDTTSVPSGTLLQCTSQRALNFQTHNLITGINIIDGMLFWTDNISEPKKINIERSIGGTGGATELPVSVGTLFTGDNADWHTRLCITPDKHHSLRVLRRNATETYYAEEENITVIKKGPRTPPTLKMSRHDNDRDGDDTFSPTTTGIIGNPDNTALDNCLTKLEVTVTDTFRVPKDVGDTIGDIILDNPVNWKEGDVILFNQQQDINSAEGFTEHDVRATVKAPLPSPIPSVGPWYMDIQSIDGDDIDEEQKMWNLRLEEKKPMFEFKFVRFAYRYKYEDGEYSTFSPWSELAFLPGEYDFLPKKGYNLGMTNRLRQLKITNYIIEPSERPKDVIEVDLLYKDEVSPNIYTVETIKRTDGWTAKGELLWPDILNGPNVLATAYSRGEYEVTSELIHKAVPSNQMLRPWDNVPRKALAQSISSNRLVYGNYLQNFNLISSLSCGDEFDTEIKPKINVTLRAVDAPLNAPAGTSNDPLNQEDDAAGFALPGRTARSLRTYQVGVVYGDVYGRETPVLAGHNGTGSLTIAKENSSTLNKIRVDISTPAPDFAHYYKLYIKETSNEYYNLAMDRWYNAEDGNVWLSFASADRNKVDDETTLVLKKKHDSHAPVTDKARYKILAIENQAPDFIKTNIKNLGSLTNGAGGTDIGTTANGFPAPDADKCWFTTGITGISEIFDSPGVAEAQMTSMRNKGTLYFRVRTDTIRSDWYQVAGYTVGGGRHKFKSDKPFGDDMAFTSVGGDISTVITGLRVELAEHTIENKKEFEGRFFVKIYKDLVLQNEILSSIVPEYRVRTAMPIGYFNIPAMDTPTTIPNSYTAKWEAAGLNLKHEYDASTSAGDDWCGHETGDKELFFQGANGSYLQGRYWSAGCGLNGRGSVHRNTELWCGASTGRFHIDNMWVRGDKDWNCAGSCCVGVRNDEQGSAGNMGRGIHTSDTPTLGGQSMDIGYITNETNNNTPYNWGSQEAEDFYDLIRAPGTRFRWREDPDELVYVVTSSIPASATGNPRHGMLHTWHDVTASGSHGGDGNNKYRFQINFQRDDGSPGGFAPNGSASQYNPIGGKEITKVPGREEMGYWGGVMSNTATQLNRISAGGGSGAEMFEEIEIPLPPGYSANSFVATAGPSTSSGNSTNVDAGGVPLTVDKQTQGCRYRRHTSVFHHIEILEPLEDDDTDWSSENPAIWETEPKEDVGVDIYYEASPALPIRVDYKTNEMFAPYGSKVVNIAGKHIGTDITAVGFPADNYVVAWSGNRVAFTYPIMTDPTGTGQRIGFERPDGLVTYAIVWEGVDSGLCGSNPAPGPHPAYYCTSSNTFSIHHINECPADDNYASDAPHNQPVDLGWYNAYAYGNGIESDRIRDDYNQVTIANGVKASSVIATQYEEERRQTGLIHSGIYNSTSGVNDLNQFIAAEKITKDMNPEYGSIQKLHTRQGDIVVMHEDKIMKVMADKDALFNADGKSNVAISSNFLGSDWAFATKYGISTNPESFATDLHGRIYFADRARSAVLRLSGDGITNISDYGMKDWFNDHLGPHTGIIVGSYDAKKSLYNISLEGYIAPEISDESSEDDDIYDPNIAGGCGCAPDIVSEGDDAFDDDADPISDVKQPNLPGYTFFQKTLSFSEQAKGWVSFKSFFPEAGVSINNEYYTWRGGNMYQHHANNTRNYFYGNQYKSSVNILFNDEPETVKSFTALNYEGSIARITPHVLPMGGWDDGEYYNLSGKDGWYIANSTTNLQSSGELEFKDKEGKYFSYMKGVATTLANLDEQEFSVQGIGVLGGTSDPPTVGPPPPGDPEELIDYCLEITPLVNCGEVLGCMDSTAVNFEPSATIDDGSCFYPDVYGCMDANAENYDPLANEPCDSNNGPPCQPNVFGENCCCCYRVGCMDSTGGDNPDVYGICADGITNVGYPNYGACLGNGYAITNYDPLACENEGCTPCPSGCIDPLATNYDPSALCDDFSCTYPAAIGGCMDSYASNYDPLATFDDGSCLYDCVYDGNDSLDINEETQVGDGDGQFYLAFDDQNTIDPMNMPVGGVGSAFWTIEIINGSGVNIAPNIPEWNASPTPNCAAFSVNDAMADPINNAACMDPSISCFKIWNGGTRWHFYVQGLPSGTYEIILTNNYQTSGNWNWQSYAPNGCYYTTNLTIGAGGFLDLPCDAPFDVDALMVAHEINDNLANIPTNYGTDSAGNVHTYTSIVDPVKLVSTRGALGFTEMSMLQNKYFVEKANGDFATPKGFQLVIPNLTKLPWALAEAIDDQIKNQAGVYNQLLILDADGLPEGPYNTTGFHNILFDHTSGIFNNTSNTAWYSHLYPTWSDFYDDIVNLEYVSAQSNFPNYQPGDKIFHALVSNYLYADYFDLRYALSRYAGDYYGFFAFNLISIDEDKCNCNECGCMDPNATNYDPTATYDDGSCT